MKKAKLITSSAVVMTMVMSSIVPAFAYSKEETVYSKLKTNGTEKTTVVSEHLINDQNETSLDDQSSLKKIKNVCTARRRRGRSDRKGSDRLVFSRRGGDRYRAVRPRRPRGLPAACGHGFPGAPPLPCRAAFRAPQGGRHRAAPPRTRKRASRPAVQRRSGG